jgi:hypothetical protein
MAVPWLRPLVAGLLPQRLVFDLRQVRVGFVVGKVKLGRGFLPVLRCIHVTIVPSMLHAHSFITDAAALATLIFAK